MAKRIKTIPAIEPNAGLKAALQKRLIALIEKQTREATAELLRNRAASRSLSRRLHRTPHCGDAKRKRS